MVALIIFRVVWEGATLQRGTFPMYTMDALAGLFATIPQNSISQGSTPILFCDGSYLFESTVHHLPWHGRLLSRIIRETILGIAT